MEKFKQKKKASLFGTFVFPFRWNKIEKKNKIQPAGCSIQFSALINTQQDAQVTLGQFPLSKLGKNFQKVVFGRKKAYENLQICKKTQQL